MRVIPVVFLSLCAFFGASAQVNVLTYRFDNGRTGANLNETILTPSSVAAGFGKLYSRFVDDVIYAQPLYVSNVAIPGAGTHNVVYVVTMSDSVYAFDADSNQGANANPLWTVSLINPAAGITPVPIADVADGGNILGNVGIEGTPVIDLAVNAIYLVARTKENGAYFQRLHALDIRTGAELPQSPVTISGSVPGSAPGSIAGRLYFDPKIHNQRPGLAEVKNQIVISWASHEDLGPYHGWVMTYDKSSLAQTGVYCTTPNGQAAGIWMSGWAPAVDSSSYMYFVDGNGTWDGRRNFGESVLKMTTTERLALTDYFTPFDWNYLNGLDIDLGDSGFMLIPGSTYGIIAGKSSKIYLLNTQRLGYTVFNDTEVPQVFDLHTLNASLDESKGGPTYWNRPASPMLYIQAEGDVIRGFPIIRSGTAVSIDTSPADIVSSRDYSTQDAGGVLVVSGDPAGQSAIVWSSTGTNAADHQYVPGLLRALDPSNGLTSIWDTGINPERDGVGNWAKFVPPVIANGRVYLATFSNTLNVYGLLP